jgi:hypothetical protein
LTAPTQEPDSRTSYARPKLTNSTNSTKHLSREPGAGYDTMLEKYREF